jgi:ABC transport system ATP-binding/permease protein
MHNISDPNFINDLLLQYSPTENNRLFIGRRTDDNDKRIPGLIDYSPDTRVSRFQAELWVSGMIIYIEDKQSSMGTFVNGNNISGKGPQILQQNDLVSFSSYTYVIKISSNQDSRIPRSEPRASEKNLLMDSINKYRPTKEKPLHIGRRYSGDSRYPFLDLPDNLLIGRKHAIIWIDGDSIFIKDTDSTNGTFVNKIVIPKEGVKRLQPGDIVEMGDIPFLIEQPGSPAESTFSKEIIEPHKSGTTLLQLVDVEKNKRLQKTNFRLEQGDFLVIMGPSGCGKSTVLKIMCGEISATSGDVVYFINGEHKRIKKDWSIINKYIGYVPQNDILHDELTVHEELRFAARLRMLDASESEREERINQVLNDLGIINCIDQQIKGAKTEVSGGQRKRVSIALEMLTKPSILYLDEPTSPLDPGAIEDLMECLKHMNHNGTTIVMVSHKQEDLQYANKVLFLGADGYQAYHGATGFALFDYFDVKSAKEIYKKINVKKDAENFWHKYYLAKKTVGLKESKKQFETRKTINRKGSVKGNLFKQFFILTHRLFIEESKKTKSFYWRAIVIPLGIAMMIAWINAQIDIGLLFWAAITAIFFGISNTMSVIVREMDIYNREKMTVVKNLPYLTSKVAYAVFLSFIQSGIFIGVIFFSFNIFRADLILFNMHYFFLFYWLLVISASCLGLLVSSFVKSVQMSYGIMPILLVIQIIFSGVIVTIDGKKMEVTSYFVISRWGTEGFARIQNIVTKDTLKRDTAFMGRVASEIFGNSSKSEKANKIIVLKYSDTLVVTSKKIALPVNNLKDGPPLLNESKTIQLTNFKRAPRKKNQQTVLNPPQFPTVYTLPFGRPFDSTKDSIISVTQLYKTIYYQAKNVSKDTFYIKNKVHDFYLSESSVNKPINSLDALSFIKNKKLFRLFSGLEANILALILLNLICLGFAYFFLWKKSNI